MNATERLAEDVQVRQWRWAVYPSIVLALFTLALIVRFHGISVPIIWYDEGYSLMLSERSPALIWSTTAGDVHPPLYYVILHYWTMLFGASVVAVRGLSTVADVGTVLLCIKLMSLLATRRATCIAGVLLVLLPISVRYSQEVRMYTLVGFWLMAATVALVCWSRQPQLKRYPVMYVLLMTAAFYTHYFAALCVLVHWLYWSGLGSGESASLPVRKWLMANVAIVVLYSPWLPHFIDQTWKMKGLEWITPTTWEMLPSFIAQCVAMISATDGGLWGGLIVSAVIIACCVMALRYGRSGRRSTVLVIAYFFVPVITVFFLSLAVPIFVPRYLVFAAAGLPLFVAVVLDRLAERRPVIAFLCLSMFVAGEVHGLQKVYSQQDGLNGTFIRKMARLDTLADGIKREAEAGDELVVDGLYWYLPFHYYNTTGIQPRLYIARLPTGASDGPSNYGGWLLIPQTLDWIFFDNVATVKLSSKRVWWVTGRPRPEKVVTFPKGWKQTQTLKGGEVEARLFILGDER